MIAIELKQVRDQFKQQLLELERKIDRIQQKLDERNKIVNID